MTSVTMTKTQRAVMRVMVTGGWITVDTEHGPELWTPSGLVASIAPATLRGLERRGWVRDDKRYKGTERTYLVTARGRRVGLIEHYGNA